MNASIPAIVRLTSLSLFAASSAMAQQAHTLELALSAKGGKIATGSWTPPPPPSPPRGSFG